LLPPVHICCSKHSWVPLFKVPFSTFGNLPFSFSPVFPLT